MLGAFPYCDPLYSLRQDLSVNQISLVCYTGCPGDRSICLFSLVVQC